ncbi:hydrolase [Mediterraneibacter butyricigenes]|uniref:Hydrolase n=1 Tax=Mediterraneibacter butyricigenes TaxID=2316025 RepID=A0A391NZ21_9FIRM|nr:MBL fold metallo-hydrolase [Mediterraneibacter butyricigenes]GCA65790.1 hydrolase [Mediterraneibacter butyricigenes]
MVVTYIEHSGFSVELPECTLLFDYYLGKLPEFPKEHPLIVFASHVHGDHFQKKIFQLREQYQEVYFVLSDDIPKKYDAPDVIWVSSDVKVTVAGCEITCLKSTDEGVAFLVKCGEKTVYHAGDLNWWHWEEESATYNDEMKQNYQREVDKLEGRKIDAAFVPVDPRLEDAYFWGIDYFMRKTDTKVVFPMHFWGKYETIDCLIRQKETEDYRDRIAEIDWKGERFSI